MHRDPRVNMAKMYGKPINGNPINGNRKMIQKCEVFHIYLSLQILQEGNYGLWMFVEYRYVRTV